MTSSALGRLAALIITGAALVGPSLATAAPTGTWERLPRGPLSPRSNPVGIWTGSEVVFVGGSRSPGHPSAGGGASGPPLRGAAALDPGTGRWRRLASAPVRLESPGTSTAVVGGVAYVLTPPRRGKRPTVIAYTPAQDRWRRIPAPPSGRDPHATHLVDGASRLIAYGDRQALTYDPATDKWTPLPRGPIAWRKVSQLVSVDGELVAFSCRRIPPRLSGPCLVVAAVLNLKSGLWRLLPSSEIEAWHGWVQAGRRLINPTFGVSDGGKTNGWKRAYPNGGMLDLDTASWLALPDPPSRHHWVGGAVLTAERGFYSVEHGWVLDTAGGDQWLRLPELTPRREIVSRTSVSAGRDLVVFGGVEWKRFKPDLFADAWIWRAPAPATGPLGR